MNYTTVVNVKKKFLNERGYTDLVDYLKDPNHIYIARDMTCYVKGAIGSKWANPFNVKDYGRDRCLELYEKYIRNNKNLWNDLESLRGKELGCWCHPEACHGDVLVKLINEKFSEH